MDTLWTVWVGGVDDSTYKTKEAAEIVAEVWRSEGYDDVVVEEHLPRGCETWLDVIE